MGVGSEPDSGVLTVYNRSSPGVHSPMHATRDHHLPPDPDAYRHAPHPKGRIVVIAPTRAACETIELALGLHIETLPRAASRRASPRAGARSGKGFGIVAGTGTGKTLAIRPIAEEILGTTELRVGVVNREREATPETPTLERHHRHDRHRAALVPGRRHPRDATRSSSTRSTRRRRSSSCASRSASASAAASSGCRRRSIRRSTRATSTRADVLEVFDFDPAEGGAGARCCDKRADRVSRRRASCAAS